jgi:hypothetical protein
VITPLVQEAKKPHRWLILLGIYATGAVLSSATLGVTLGLLGTILIPGGWASVAVAIVAAAGIVLGFADLGVGGAKTPTLRRQTCPIWWHIFGPARTMLLWGIDLGLGFTTIRVASLYWIVALVAAILGLPLSAAILGGYGFALALSLGVGVILLRHQDRVLATVSALRLFPRLKMSLAIVLLLWCVLLLVVALRGV